MSMLEQLEKKKYGDIEEDRKSLLGKYWTSLVGKESQKRRNSNLMKM